MLMLHGSSLAGVVAPLPRWPRKPTPLDQLQPFETRMSFFSDDDVVVYRDPQGLCDFHNDPRHYRHATAWGHLRDGCGRGNSFHLPH
jgi:hypothetical protein